MEELWKLFLSALSKPLRRSFVVAIGILSIQIESTKLLLQIDFREVVLGSYFLTTFTFVATALALQILRYAEPPWSVVGFYVGLFATVGLVGLTWNQWQYLCEQGICHQRHWDIVDRTGDRWIMSWQLQAAESDPRRVVISIRVDRTHCQRTIVENLHPVVVRNGSTGVRIDGAETGPKGSSEFRQYTFEGFRRPAVLRFLLTLVDVDSSVHPEDCIYMDLSVDDSSPDSKKSEQKEEH
jgi:hypothetical protein